MGNVTSFQFVQIFNFESNCDLDLKLEYIRYKDIILF